MRLAEQITVNCIKILVDGEDLQDETVRLLKRLADKYHLSLRKTNKKVDFRESLESFVLNSNGYKDNLNDLYNCLI